MGLVGFLQIPGGMVSWTPPRISGGIPGGMPPGTFHNPRRDPTYFWRDPRWDWRDPASHFYLGVKNTSKILSVLKAVFVLLRINHWTTLFNLWNLLVTAVLFVRQFASVLVIVVMQKLCLLQQLRTVTATVRNAQCCCSAAEWLQEVLQNSCREAGCSSRKFWLFGQRYEAV